MRLHGARAAFPDTGHGTLSSSLNGDYKRLTTTRLLHDKRKTCDRGLFDARLLVVVVIP